MTEAILHLGSNQGSRIKNLRLCQILISQTIGLIGKSSNVYETEAWGNTDQAPFLNFACVVTTSLSADELLAACQKIEFKMGRKKLIKWGPRNIDLDILFFGNEIIEKANLKIPHPEITNRNFVLVPLMDICPTFIHPILNKSISDLHIACLDTKAVLNYSI